MELSFFIICCITAFARIPLIKVKDSNAKCMDGSPPAFYFDPATTSKYATKWVLALQGGGECASKDFCDSRESRLKGSASYPAYVNDLSAMTSASKAKNPELYHWNRVRLMYCSQDLWTGQVTSPSQSTFGYHFSGHLIVKSILDRLDYSAGLQNATEIILSGESAGGIGVWANLDFVAERYPNSRVVGAPIAGFYFFAYPYTGPGHTDNGLVDFREPYFPQYYKLWSSFVDQTCASSLQEPSHCILSNYSYPFVATPVFVTEAQSDKVVLTAHDSVPNEFPHFTAAVADYLAAWSANMTGALRSFARRRPDCGYFNAACFIHTTFSEKGPLIQKLSYHEVFLNWYNKVEGSLQLAMDTCGLLCGDHCPSF